MPEPALYIVRVREHLDPRWSDYLPGMEIAHEDGGTTALSGRLPDQAALHGLLRKIRDVGLPLLAVTCLDANADVPAEDEP